MIKKAAMILSIYIVCLCLSTALFVALFHVNCLKFTNTPDFRTWPRLLQLPCACCPCRKKQSENCVHCSERCGALH